MKLRATGKAHVGLAFVLMCGLASESRAQTRSLSVRELAHIYESGGDTFGWDEFDVPEFVAATYGGRARAAIVTILSEPSTAENYYLQLEALTTAQYARVGVPVETIIPYARGAKGSSVGGVLRHRATMALSMRADSTLQDFWLQVSRNPDPSFRQLAAAGLSCALGTAALPHLSAMRTDESPAVSRVADFYFREHTTKGQEALACGGTVSRELSFTFPQTLRPELRARGEPILRRTP
jgi:hypothetical protein